MAIFARVLAAASAAAQGTPDPNPTPAPEADAGDDQRTPEARAATDAAAAQPAPPTMLKAISVSATRNRRELPRHPSIAVPHIARTAMDIPAVDDVGRGVLSTSRG